MGRSHAFAFGLGLMLAATLAGCTFLISFDEVAGLDAADTGTDRGGNVIDVAVDGSTTDDTDTGGSQAFPPACDPTFPLGQVNCNGSSRPNCAKALATYPDAGDRASDLVTCTGGTATCVQHCPFGCAEMPNFPDQCDDCNGRENGFYCGRDLRGWIAANSDLAVRCENGKSNGAAVCGAANSNRCATKCPNNNGSPSCCQ